MAPQTRYARSGELHIAYQLVGEGPIDILWVPTWIWQVEHVWAEPYTARMLRELSAFARVIMFDRRGTGLSDPVAGVPTLEEQMDDVVAVMDAVGSTEAALIAMLEAGAMACLFAATHPERTRALVLWQAMARMTAAPGYEWPPSAEDRDAWAERLTADWGSGERVINFAHPADEEFRQWAGRLERLAASPGTAYAMNRMLSEVDVRPVLGMIQAPTLIANRPADANIDNRHAHYLAEHIAGAHLKQVSGQHTLPFGPGQEELAAHIEEFLTGTRRPVETERVLATVMFSDIVDSTSRAAAMGDRRWRELLESLTSIVSRELQSFRGRAIKTLGDGFLATFDGPARAIRCATRVRDAAQARFGIDLRTGLHTGEVEVMGSDVGGLAVHIAARVIGQAGPGEVVVSGTVKDLVVGSGIAFVDRGEHELRGVPDRWRLWAVAS